jgi:plasmid stabilization system protein ParE
MGARAVVFRPQAADDVREVQGWYDSRRAGLGREFGVAVETIVERIAANPGMFHRVHGEVRRAVLSRFPYAIYFRSTADQVVVLAIHGRQHPSRWTNRS